jgi:hypothetical protein
MSVRVDVREQLAAVCVALALCVSMSGCKKDAPSMDAAGETKHPHESADPVAQLAQLEGRMRSLGLPVAADTRAMAEGEEDDGVGAAASGDVTTDAQDQPVEEAPAPAPAEVGAPPSSRDETINYCGDLCSLSESICSLEVRICSLAKTHANDTIYADACERAVEDCEVAGEACDSCG